VKHEVLIAIKFSHMYCKDIFIDVVLSLFVILDVTIE